MAWGQILGEYASTEPGNVLAMWSNPHEGSDKRSRAAEARQHVREDAERGDVGFDGRAGSARTDGRTIRWRSVPSARAARRAQARKEKARTTIRVGERAQARVLGPPRRSRVLYCHRKGHIKEVCRIRIADERDSKSKDEKDKRKDKRFRQNEKERVNAMEGRGHGNPRNEQQHQSRRGPGHGRRVASTHDLRGQSHAWLDRVPVRLQMLTSRLNGCGKACSGML